MNQTPRIRLLLPEGEEREFRLQADYFAGHIDLKSFCSAFPDHPTLDTNPLVPQPQPGRSGFLPFFGAQPLQEDPAERSRKRHSGVSHAQRPDPRTASHAHRGSPSAQTGAAIDTPAQTDPGPTADHLHQGKGRSWRRWAGPPGGIGSGSN
jgi:hypothetical protein